MQFTASFGNWKSRFSINTIEVFRDERKNTDSSIHQGSLESLDGSVALNESMNRYKWKANYEPVLLWLATFKILVYALGFCKQSNSNFVPFWHRQLSFRIQLKGKKMGSQRIYYGEYYLMRNISSKSWLYTLVSRGTIFRNISVYGRTEGSIKAMNKSEAKPLTFWQQESNSRLLIE